MYVLNLFATQGTQISCTKRFHFRACRSDLILEWRRRTAAHPCSRISSEESRWRHKNRSKSGRNKYRNRRQSWDVQFKRRHRRKSFGESIERENGHRFHGRDDDCNFVLAESLGCRRNVSPRTWPWCLVFYSGFQALIIFEQIYVCFGVCKINLSVECVIQIIFKADFWGVQFIVG